MKNSLYRPLDHFLQAEIISRLATSDMPMRFRDLKDDGIENSLFMYHANKLISRDLVQKSDDGFSLTLKGARWANYVDTSLDLTPLTPRPLVQFIIEDSARNILLAKRKGSLKYHLNEYLLPGNVYRHGFALDENIKLILTELFGENHSLEAIPTTIADVIHSAQDDFKSHVICYIFQVKINSEKRPPLDHSLFDVEWVAPDSVTSDDPKYTHSEFLTLLFKRLPSISPHETFRIKIQ